MRAATEELLLILAWSVETAMVPTWRNLNSSFENWAWRSGFGRRLQYLERQKFLEKRPGAKTSKWIYRLTEEGRLAALGGRDPGQCWSRSWDGLWRMILFDLPQDDTTLRQRLWRWLRRHGFGYLQNSLWIVPDFTVDLTTQWPAKHPDVETWVIFEGRPIGGASDREIVVGAWDFEEINNRYRSYCSHLERVPDRGQGELAVPAGLRAWIRKERALWQEALSRDPLLPDVLLPRNYLGRKAWHRRSQVWKRLARGLQTKR